jgi:hypothetical protein
VVEKKLEERTMGGRDLHAFDVDNQSGTTRQRNCCIVSRATSVSSRHDTVPHTAT